MQFEMTRYYLIVRQILLLLAHGLLFAGFGDVHRYRPIQWMEIAEGYVLCIDQRDSNGSIAPILYNIRAGQKVVMILPHKLKNGGWNIEYALRDGGVDILGKGEIVTEHGTKTAIERYFLPIAKVFTKQWDWESRGSYLLSGGNRIESMLPLGDQRILVFGSGAGLPVGERVRSDWVILKEEDGRLKPESFGDWLEGASSWKEEAHGKWVSTRPILTFWANVIAVQTPEKVMLANVVTGKNLVFDRTKGRLVYRWKLSSVVPDAQDISLKVDFPVRSIQPSSDGSLVIAAQPDEDINLSKTDMTDSVKGELSGDSVMISRMSVLNRVYNRVTWYKYDFSVKKLVSDSPLDAPVQIKIEKGDDIRLIYSVPWIDGRLLMPSDPYDIVGAVDSELKRLRRRQMPEKVEGNLYTAAGKS